MVGSAIRNVRIDFSYSFSIYPVIYSCSESVYTSAVAKSVTCLNFQILCLNITIIMKRILLAVSILMLFALITGCTQTPPVQNTPVQGGNIVIGAVDQMPTESNIVIQVAPKDSLHKTIDVTFAGGAGQVQVKSIEVVYNGGDGGTHTQQLLPNKGATVTLQGTDQTDHVQVYVTLFNGKRYMVVNQTAPYQKAT
jgi:archaellum component FlaF (FlaF/FlaG flagellin family)